MTLNEFNNLRIGDKVRLSFSSMPDHIVREVSISKKMITTYPVYYSELSYVNSYEDIEFVEHAVDPEEAERANIKNAIVESFKRLTFHCAKCPFNDGCKSIKNGRTLCGIIFDC